MLTLHAESVRFIGSIPLVPIHKFRSFIMDVKGFLPEMCVIASSASAAKLKASIAMLCNGNCNKDFCYIQ